MKAQTKAQPAPPPSPGSPARGSGEPDPGRVCASFPVCLSALVPGPRGPLGLLTAGPGQGVAWEGAAWGEWVENQGECPPTQSRGVRGCSGWVPLFPFVPPLSFSVVILRPREGQPLPQGHTAQGRPLGAHCSPLPRGFLLMGHLWCQGPLLGDHWPLWMQMPGRTRCSPAC